VNGSSCGYDGAVELEAIDVNCEPVTAPLTALAQRVADTMRACMATSGSTSFGPRRARSWIEGQSAPDKLANAGLKPALGLNVAQRCWLRPPRIPAAGAPSGLSGPMTLNGHASA